MKLDVDFSQDALAIDVDFEESGQQFDAVLGKIQVLHDGQNGATFTPAVSAEGVVSWTNDRDLPNPAPVNIKGPKGDTGPAGKDGADGISPVVAVEDIDGGHRVTITDKDGTKSFDVMNGKDGVNTEGYSVILEMLNQHERRITALEQGNGNVDGTTAILGVATLGNMKLV